MIQALAKISKWSLPKLNICYAWKWNLLHISWRWVWWYSLLTGIALKMLYFPALERVQTPWSNNRNLKYSTTKPSYTAGRRPSNCSTLFLAVATGEHQLSSCFSSLSQSSDNFLNDNILLLSVLRVNKRWIFLAADYEISKHDETFLIITNCL